MMWRIAIAALGIGMGILPVRGQGIELSDLARLTDGRTEAQNALWVENSLEKRFHCSKRVVVAKVKGPAVITMIHFAMPQSHFGEPLAKLNRDLLLKMYWDGETSPSVDCPLVDFFCDPAGTREVVNTALVNKRRGFNAYFPMPFRKSAKVELVYDGPVEPGEKLWRLMPCYSYVMYRMVDQIPGDMGYFHAYWRQEGLLLGRRDYVALEAKGKGKFVGWNVSIRRPGRSGYPVDMNEKFYIDGESTAAIEFQGLEDSFGFSWGFPPTESIFPLTGFFPFFKGAMAYRFFINDAISFERSLKVTVGFGKHEHPTFREQFSKQGSELQLSRLVYWYQTEPHAPIPPMPVAEQREPAPEDPFWLGQEQLPSAEELKGRGVRLHMLCGRPGKEVVFAERGYTATAKQGYTWDGWSMPVYHCRASEEQVQIELTVPKGVKGLVRVYVIDPDNFQGGRRQKVTIAGQSLELVENFQKGRWLEYSAGHEQTSSGSILIKAMNARSGSNAVISIVEWVEQIQ